MGLIIQYANKFIHLKSLTYFSGKAYKMFDDQYMEFDNATEHCTGLAAR